MSGNPVGPGIAVTGLAIPLGWYVVVAVALLVLGFLLVRYVVRTNNRRRNALTTAH
jgi:Flp pilus assembly protein TadB